MENPIVYPRGEELARLEEKYKNLVAHRVRRDGTYGERYARLIEEYDRAVEDFKSWTEKAEKIIDRKIQTMDRLKEELENAEIIFKKIKELVEEMKSIEAKKQG
ncbi:MAG: hypothetical protein WC694_02955 [Candidatus Paceibacterota bacterium]|jgi:hypothetical protein